MSNDTKNMSFTDLVAKLNEIEQRDKKERRARHEAQVEAAREKKAKSKTIAETLKEAMAENTIEEPIISPDQFNNKAQKNEGAMKELLHDLAEKSDLEDFVNDAGDYGMTDEEATEFWKSVNEDVNEDHPGGHDIHLLKAVADQMQKDIADGDYTAIDDLLKDIPEATLKGFLSEVE